MQTDLFGSNLTPKTLNEGLTNFNSPALGSNALGYTSTGGVIWQGASLYARSAFANQCLNGGGTADACILQGRSSIAWKGIKNGSKYRYEDMELQICSGNPVILEVPSPSAPNDPRKSHFVLAVGTTVKNGQKTFLIQDPASDLNGESILSDNYAVVRGARLYRPALDPAMMHIYASAHIDFVVTDPLGRRAGRNPITGIAYDEIPGASYLLEAGIADANLSDGQDNSTQPQRVFENVESPIEGTYSVQIYSLSGGPYEIQTYGFDVNGDINALSSRQGTLLPGGMASLTFAQSNAPLETDESREGKIKIRKAVVLERPGRAEDKVVLLGTIRPEQDGNAKCSPRPQNHHRYCDRRQHSSGAPSSHRHKWRGLHDIWEQLDSRNSQARSTCHKDRESIALANEVTLQVGSFSVTVPASAFKKKMKGKETTYVYERIGKRKLLISIDGSGEFAVYIGNENIGPDNMAKLNLELKIDDLVGKIEIGLRCKKHICEGR